MGNVFIGASQLLAFQYSWKAASYSAKARLAEYDGPAPLCLPDNCYYNRTGLTSAQIRPTSRLGFVDRPT